MQALEESQIACPYCGEWQTLLLDGSEPEQEYIEDCQICCRPITIKTQLDADGRLHVHVQTENDT